MDENLNLTKGNTEIEEALKDFEAKSDTGIQQRKPTEGLEQHTVDPSDISKKAREAFKEFELKQKIEHKEPQIVTSPIAEINESLKEFEQKQQADNILKSKKNEKADYSEVPKMVRFVIKYSRGLIKNENQANYVLLTFTIIFFLVSGYLFYLGMKGNKPPKINMPPVNVVMPNVPNQVK